MAFEFKNPKILQNETHSNTPEQNNCILQNESKAVYAQSPRNKTTGF
jgi:hypothetical protein